MTIVIVKCFSNNLSSIKLSLIHFPNILPTNYQLRSIVDISNEMENLNNEINSDANHFRNNFSDAVLLGQDDLDIMNLESSNTIPVDTTALNFDQGNEQNTGTNILGERDILPSEAWIAIPIINDISYLNTDSIINELNSSGINVQDDPEIISTGTKWRISYNFQSLKI